MVKIVTLTRESLAELAGRISSGARLDEILVQNSPDAEIFILRRRKLGTRPVVIAAYFNPYQAQQELRTYAQRESPDDVYMVSGTAADLHRGRISDPKTQQPLDDLNSLFVYLFLGKDLLSVSRN